MKGSRLRQLLWAIGLVSLSCFCVIITPQPALSDSGKAAYNKARARYLEVKRADPEVTNLARWEDAASQLVQFVEKNRKSSYVPSALYNLGRLYQKTYEVRHLRTGLSRAVFYYEKLAKEYSGNSLVDDGLLFLGDLRRDALADEVAARAAYYEILDVYSSGDKVREAKKRLGLVEKKNQPAAPPTKEEPQGKAEQKEPETKKVKEKLPTIEKKKSTSLSKIFGSAFRKPSSRKIYSREKSVRRPLVVIDPGHGGDELGASGVSGSLEKDVVLSVSFYLDELLRERLRARTLLTRARDVSLPLEERTRMANGANADLFLSIHANASPRHTARGIETYYLDNTNDKSSLKLAERENQSARLPKGDLGFMLSDLIQNAKLDESISLSHHVQNALVRRMSRYYRETRDLGVKKAPFYVLVGAHMPCVLVEISFIDHPIEGKRLTTRRYQKLLAESIYQGIRSFFATNPPS